MLTLSCLHKLFDYPMSFEMNVLILYVLMKKSRGGNSRYINLMWLHQPLARGDILHDRHTTDIHVSRSHRYLKHESPFSVTYGTVTLEGSSDSLN